MYIALRESAKNFRGLFSSIEVIVTFIVGDFTTNLTRELKTLLGKGISHQQKIAIDRWFSVPFAVVRWVGEIVQKPNHQSENHAVIVKLFGMGSIVRIMHELHLRQVDLNKVTLITHQENDTIANRLGFQTHIVGGSNLWQMATSAFRVRNAISNREKTTILDLERSSNLIGMFSHVMAFNKTLFGFGKEQWNGKGSQFICAETNAMQDLITLAFGGIAPDASNQFQTAISKRKHQILINVNASEYLSERRFPAQKFVLLIEQISEAFPDACFILTGSENEKPYVDQVYTMLKSKGVDALNRAGAWSLNQLCDEISHSELLITNDSGPMHLANFFKTPSAVIWGPTSPDRIGYPDSDLMLNISLNMPCQPCFVHPKSEVAKACGGTISCLNEMEVDRMSAQIIQFANQVRQTSILPNEA